MSEQREAEERGAWMRENGVLLFGGLVVLITLGWGLRVHYAHKYNARPSAVHENAQQPTKNKRAGRIPLPAACKAEVSFAGDQRLFENWNDVLLKTSALVGDACPPLSRANLSEPGIARAYACGGCDQTAWNKGECPPEPERISAKFGGHSIDFVFAKGLGAAALPSGTVLLKDGNGWVKSKPLLTWTPLNEDDLEAGHDVVMQRPDGGGDPQPGTLKPSGYVREYYSARGDGLFVVRIPDAAGEMRVRHENGMLILSGGGVDGHACDARIDG